LALTLASAATAPSIAAQELATSARAVEIVVVGSPHLRQLDAAQRPATEDLLQHLLRYEPDLVVVEWLHPSIDRATTEAYRGLADRAGLSREWELPLEHIGSATEAARARIASARRTDRSVAALRVELGKLHYLAGDQLNAGYQWWLAEQDGADVDSLKRLTSNNFEGHELEVWGFPVAAARGHDYLTPFDYQGDDAAWIWDEIVQQVALYLVDRKHGLREGAPGWEPAVERFFTTLQAGVGGSDSTWFREYGSIREGREFLEVITRWTARRQAEAPQGDANGLTMMQGIQSPAHLATKRVMYDEVYPMISHEGLGKRLVDNWLLRNARMADFVEQDIARLGARRVLVLVGEGHKPFLDDEFRKRGYRVASSVDLLR
jgi:hypothetical protein